MRLKTSFYNFVTTHSDSIRIITCNRFKRRNPRRNGWFSNVSNSSSSHLLDTFSREAFLTSWFVTQRVECDLRGHHIRGCSPGTALVSESDLNSGSSDPPNVLFIFSSSPGIIEFVILDDYFELNLHSILPAIHRRRKAGRLSPSYDRRCRSL